MKNIKALGLLLSINLIIPIGFSKSINSWNDTNQDSIQINAPVEFIDTFNNYSVISKNIKIKLTDFGDIENNKAGKKYTLKKYGVQILNNDKIYNLFKTTTSLKSNVDFNLLYHDKNIIALRVRDNSTIDYVKKPFRSFTVNTYVYNINSNKFSAFSVLNSESELDGKQLNLLSGDQFTFNSKKGIYTYLANIKYASNDRVGIFKVDLSNSLKCISATLGCENVGLDLAEINK
ncbi:hypothetical protein [Acinetobacter sp. KS-LM10]|uniref:hypothetical protein n=1 Tax=Acinetobacter sp. KS-LM10 TaxID=3120518 RepID=UPI0030CDBA83